jgi:hypothetical protein
MQMLNQAQPSNLDSFSYPILTCRLVASSTTKKNLLKTIYLQMHIYLQINFLWIKVKMLTVK